MLCESCGTEVNKGIMYYVEEIDKEECFCRACYEAIRREEKRKDNRLSLTTGTYRRKMNED